MYSSCNEILEVISGTRETPPSLDSGDVVWTVRLVGVMGWIAYCRCELRSRCVWEMRLSPQVWQRKALIIPHYIWALRFSRYNVVYTTRATLNADLSPVVTKRPQDGHGRKHETHLSSFCIQRFELRCWDIAIRHRHKISALAMESRAIFCGEEME